MWPTMIGTWAKWAPKNEKSILIGVGNSGANIGSIMGFSVGGLLCHKGEWPSIFYYFGKCSSMNRFVTVISS
jgi:MFS family permease